MAEGGVTAEQPSMAVLMDMLVKLNRSHQEGRQEFYAVRQELEEYKREACKHIMTEIKEELEEVMEGLQDVSRRLEAVEGNGVPPTAPWSVGMSAQGGAGGLPGAAVHLPPPLLAAPPHQLSTAAPAHTTTALPLLPTLAAVSQPPASPLSPAVRLAPKRRAPQDYEGRSSWAAYHSQFEILAASQGWNEDDKAVQLITSLKGPALDVLNQLTAPQRASYTCVVDALERRYGHQHQEEVFRARFRGRVRARGETLQHLAQDIEQLVRQAYPSASEDLTTVLARDQFVDALIDPHLKLSVKQTRASNLQEALAHALEFEAVMVTSGMRPASGGSPVTGRQDHRARRTRQTGNEEDFRGKCWGCGERGHRRGACPRPSRGRGRQQGRGRTRSLGSGRSSPRPSCCWSCGETGHYSRACPNPRPVYTASGTGGNAGGLGSGATSQPPPARPHSR